MSEPSSWAIDELSPVRATSHSIRGRATSQSPSEATYAVPSVSTRGVSSNAPSTWRT